MKAQKPSEKFSLGLQGRVVTTIVGEVAKTAAEQLDKTIRDRRRQLVKRGTSPEVRQIWSAVMAEFLLRASRGYGDLSFLLREDYRPHDITARTALFREVDALLKEDGLESSCISPSASMSQAEGIGYRVSYTWSS